MMLFVCLTSYSSCQTAQTILEIHPELSLQYLPFQHSKTWKYIPRIAHSRSCCGVVTHRTPYCVLLVTKYFKRHMLSTHSCYYFTCLLIKNRKAMLSSRSSATVSFYKKFNFSAVQRKAETWGKLCRAINGRWWKEIPLKKRLLQEKSETVLIEENSTSTIPPFSNISYAGWVSWELEPQHVQRVLDGRGGGMIRQEKKSAYIHIIQTIIHRTEI